MACCLGVLCWGGWWGCVFYGFECYCCRLLLVGGLNCLRCLGWVLTFCTYAGYFCFVSVGILIGLKSISCDFMWVCFRCLFAGLHGVFVAEIRLVVRCCCVICVC